MPNESARFWAFVRFWALEGAWMARPQTFFQGDQSEASALDLAIRNNCDCKFNKDGSMNDMCPPHRMLLNDQRALDGLLAYRHLSKLLKQEEGVDDELQDV